MDRSAWLQEKRRLAEERMDTLFAPIYDEKWGTYINPTHHRFMRQFLGLVPPRGRILDAACGTGKYWSMIMAGAQSVFGIDQSGQMLLRAKAKFPEVPVEKLDLQEIGFREAFDGVMCVDAMENVGPEDWPLVLGNFHRALKPGGHLYFTVERAEESDIDKAFAAGVEMGLPVVRGEVAHDGGYHYYPPIEGVRAWLEAAVFNRLSEDVGDGYHHFIVRKD